MLPDRSSTPSGSIKLLFLALAVLVVLAQTSPDGWLKKCYYGLGRCRKSCKEEEKKREKCGKTLTCCLLSKNAKLSHFSPRPVTVRSLSQLHTTILIATLPVLVKESSRLILRVLALACTPSP
ncbi:beta-defensin 115 [Urocitellus parryii]